MSNKSQIDLNPDLATRVFRLSYKESRSFLSDPAHQRMLRGVYESPGIVVIDDALDEDTIEGLREGLSDKARKYDEAFNDAAPTSGRVLAARAEAVAQIRRITTEAFGYELPQKLDGSYRPMISADEPMHFDTYHVECGIMPLMSVLNFDRGERVWHVGPHFSEMCAARRPLVEEVLRRVNAIGAATTTMRKIARKGRGPLGDPEWVHKCRFAPNALWFSNPKIISHKLVYGRGAMFATWMLSQPECQCQKCLLEEASIAGLICAA